MKQVLTLILIITLSACSSNNVQRGNSLSAIPEHERIACSAKGGHFEGLTQFIPVCVWPATDSGKQCADNKDCQGICELPKSAYNGFVLNLKPGDSVSGVCSAKQTRGKVVNCSMYVKNGKVTSSMCID